MIGGIYLSLTCRWRVLAIMLFEKVQQLRPESWQGKISQKCGRDVDECTGMGGEGRSHTCGLTRDDSEGPASISMGIQHLRWETAENNFNDNTAHAPTLRLACTPSWHLRLGTRALQHSRRSCLDDASEQRSGSSHQQTHSRLYSYITKRCTVLAAPPLSSACWPASNSRPSSPIPRCHHRGIIWRHGAVHNACAKWAR